MKEQDVAEKELLTRFTGLERVGEGTYGIVHKALDTVANRTVALKSIRLDQENEGIPSTAIREISLLKELQHANVVRLRHVIPTDRQLTLVFEFMELDLKKLLDATGHGLDVKLAKSLSYQLLAGIQYCHRHRVLHRDLKPHNLLCNYDGTLKLADFGLARAFGIPIRSFTHEVVTLWYRPPDVLLGSKCYSTSVDIWSVGCIIAEMLTGKPLFQGTSSTTQISEIFHALGSPHNNNWQEAAELPEFDADTMCCFAGKDFASLLPGVDPVGLDLLKKMLQCNPVRRISAEEAMRHDWFCDCDIAQGRGPTQVDPSTFRYRPRNSGSRRQKDKEPAGRGGP